MCDNEAKWYSSIDDIGQNMPGWNLNTLIDEIENATSDFIEKETNRKPYFKAELISDLKDEHIDILQGVTGLSDTDRYSYWRTVFVHINLRFADNEDAWSMAQGVMARLKHLPKTIPRAPVFLLLAEVYLSHKDKADWLSSGKVLPTSSEARENELAAAIRAIDEVLHSGNIPKTRHRQAVGVNVVKAVLGLLSIFNTYNPRKRNPPTICSFLMDLRIVISPAKIRDWRRSARGRPK